MHRLIGLSTGALCVFLGTLATLASSAAALKLGAVPTQVIIQLTGAPAALRLPGAARRPGAAAARRAALNAAAAPVTTQQAAFHSAARGRGINFRQDFAYQHVRGVGSCPQRCVLHCLLAWWHVKAGLACC